MLWLLLVGGNNVPLLTGLPRDLARAVHERGTLTKSKEQLQDLYL